MATPKPAVPFFLIIFLLCFNEYLFSVASERVSFGNPLSGNKTIISQGGNFELGFFRLGNNTSTSPNYYLGIWFRNLVELTPVWIANRNSPVTDPSASELRISENGNLVLLDQNNAQIWSTNLSFIDSNSTIGELLDTGNFVLRESSVSSTSFLWESMDHPTNMVLPSAKFGKSKKAGRQKLVSWKNSFDPSDGIFSLELDPNGTNQFFVFWNGSKPFWSTGEWNGKYFTNMPEMKANADLNGKRFFDYVLNENESYFTFWTKKDSNISRFLLDVSGQIKPMTWLEKTQEWYLLWTKPQSPCDVYASCGPFGICNAQSSSYCSCVRGFNETNSRDWELGNPTGGCLRNSPLQCRTNSTGDSPDGQSDKFHALLNVALPDNLQPLRVKNAEDCELACLGDCSCTAYAYTNNCSVWYGNLLNLRQESDGSSGETLFLRLSAFEFKQTKGRKTLIISVSIGVPIGSVACFIFVFFLVRSYQKRKFILSMNALENGLFAFEYGDLRTLTNNFCEVLGRGSYGTVFKGTLPNSSIIAVKRLERLVEVGEKQFRVEVSTVGVIQHMNLVRMRGFCAEKDKRLLVYDYMPNGSLDTHLFGRNSTHLNWKTRYKIAVGVACGLAYLHEGCVDCIIHCDVKPENILLDEFFIPKLADFGMAKLVGRNSSRVLTTLKGTIGYLAPEWISGMPISEKADVYSYGMVLLEIISGRRNSQRLDIGGTHGYFPLLAAVQLNEGNASALLDHRLNGDANLPEVERVCGVACWCIQDEEQDRPTMSRVVQMLEGLLEVGLPPIPRSLQAFEDYSGSLDNLRAHSLGIYSSDSVAPTIPLFSE